MENIDNPHLASYIQAENSYSTKVLSQNRFLQRIVQREMKRRLQTRRQLPPLTTVAHGYEYFSTTSAYGMVYLRKPLGKGRDPPEVYCHTIGTTQEEDVLVFEEPDDSVFVDITSTKDMKFVTINSNSLSSSEVRVIDATLNVTQQNKPLLRLIKPRVPQLEYYVDHHDSTFYILTNAQKATNFKLVKAPDESVEHSEWEDVITMNPTEKIEDVDIFQNNIVIYGRRDGLPIILCHDLSTKLTHQVDLPGRFCVVSPGTNLEFNTDTFRFSVSSPFAHESTYEYDVEKRKLNPVRVASIQGFDKSKYTCTQIHVKSHDNQDIPVTLIHSKDYEKNSKNPVLMRSYGAYGVSTDPDFKIEHLPLLERGWVIALAHVRGGSELGRPWYEQGKLKHKMNSFRDFIAVAEHLVKTKVTSPDHLAAIGTSAGGLLVGSVLHMRPDLFRALVLRVPFVDPLSAMLNPDLPLTQVEYPEWGNPTKDKEAYECIQAYSPYENIKALSNATSLPAVFVTGGLKDQRVAYWQPLKFVAGLRHSLKESKDVLLKMDLDRGHFGGGSEQDARLSEAAEQVAFLISHVQK
ncbi:prolyl oligopeptidase family-domain-containing protein [Phycomyces blakesleeanus]|uniref:Prolyl endopeptidase n=1 Tax=Phycomyces blakesleeanus TaxID=4837 RepID=A0ABR3AJ37_PHYBL